MNSFNTKIVLTEDQIKLNIERIKANQERKKQGLPIIKYDENKPVENPPEVKEDTKPPVMGVKTENTPTNAGYAYFQSQIQNQLAYFQAERFGQIARAARKEKHILYIFDETPQPPVMGEKPRTKQSLREQPIYYSELPNEIHYKLDAMRAQVADLGYVKTLQQPTIDNDGKTTPPILKTNDKNITNVDDKTFASLSQEIDRLNKEIAMMMAQWYYGIPKELIPKIETNSLTYALEAGLYRELYGIVSDSKNSGIS